METEAGGKWIITEAEVRAGLYRLPCDGQEIAPITSLVLDFDSMPDITVGQHHLSCFVAAVPIPQAGKRCRPSSLFEYQTDLTSASTVKMRLFAAYPDPSNYTMDPRLSAGSGSSLLRRTPSAGTVHMLF